MGVYIGKSARRSLSAETRWRDCEEAPAAQAGPKRREALAPEARHGKLDTGFKKINGATFAK
jgi:hypothetical protein